MTQPSYSFDVVSQKARPTMIMRARISLPQLPTVIAQSLGAVVEYLGRLGEHPAGPPFVAYHNQDMADLAVEIGFPVERPLTGQGAIVAGAIPAGRHATCLFTGAYSEIGSVYEALNQWIADHGWQVAGTTYEFYLNDPANTRPEFLQTLIAFPLAD